MFLFRCWCNVLSCFRAVQLRYFASAWSRSMQCLQHHLFFYCIAQLLRRCHDAQYFHVPKVQILTVLVTSHQPTVQMLTLCTCCFCCPPMFRFRHSTHLSTMSRYWQYGSSVSTLLGYWHGILSQPHPLSRCRLALCGCSLHNHFFHQNLSCWLHQLLLLLCAHTAVILQHDFSVALFHRRIALATVTLWLVMSRSVQMLTPIRFWISFYHRTANPRCTLTLTFSFAMFCRYHQTWSSDTYYTSTPPIFLFGHWNPHSIRPYIPLLPRRGFH